jgi:hypothetical protein
MPSDLGKFFWIEDYEYQGAWAERYNPPKNRLKTDLREVYDNVVQLGNVVMR